MKNTTLNRVKLSRKEEGSFRGLHLYRLSPAKTGPFSALRIVIAPHSHFPVIYHKRTAEFFYVLKGWGYGRVDRRRVRFKVGDSVYMRPGTLHDFHTGRSRMEALVVFSPRFDPRRPDVVKVGATSS